jgi:hypothetical protein
MFARFLNGNNKNVVIACVIGVFLIIVLSLLSVELKFSYTLVCPDETLYVYGCNGVKYKNACMAERDGVYSYSTDNGVATNDG